MSPSSGDLFTTTVDLKESPSESPDFTSENSKKVRRESLKIYNTYPPPTPSNSNEVADEPTDLSQYQSELRTARRASTSTTSQPTKKSHHRSTSTSRQRRDRH